MQDLISTFSQLYTNHQYDEAGIRIKKLWEAANGQPTNELRSIALYHAAIMQDITQRDELNKKIQTN